MIIVMDYGMGNLRSVSKAIAHLGADVRVSSGPQDLRTADKLVLPGVGAFGDAVRELKKAKLWDATLEFMNTGKPFLGICLGLQLLFESSEESDGQPGFGVFSERIRRFRSREVKIPHMGWNQVRVRGECPILRGIPDNSYFYFVHSYYATCPDPEESPGEANYGNERFTAVLWRDNIFATQFHPEKSQQAGLRILKNFLLL